MTTSCSKEERDDSRFEFKAPDYFPPPTYTFDNNPITREGFELGRTLFYDPNISRDGSVSCNNCHIQSAAFADSPVHPVSVGVDSRLGTRNAPSLTNLAFMPEFFWDGGVTHLDFAPINAIESPFEMDETVENVVKKLNASESYRLMYREAFGVDSVTLPFTLHALSQFTTMMVSADSRYDSYLRGDGDDPLSRLELEGLEVFKKKCETCHRGPLFTDFSYRNNGIDTAYSDTGRERITSLASDSGRFRVPSLRNVALTAPYMHNARFRTLEEVLDHYAHGVHRSSTLDTALSQNGGLGIPINNREKTAIIAFLHTLTDTDFTQNPMFFSK